MIKLLQQNKDLQLSFLLVVFYLSEAITKIAAFYKASFYNYSALIKGIFILFVILFTAINFNKKRKTLSVFLILMSIFFIIGQYVFNQNTLDSSFLINLIFFSRYIFVFVIVLYFIDYPFKFKSNKHLIVYEKIVLFNSLLIIIGAAFNLKLFNTYVHRFGYNGLFMVPSITTYFYALALTYFSYNYIKYNTKKMELIFVCLVSLLVGTKALLLFLGLTMIHVFIAKKIYKLKGFYIIFTFIFLAILFQFKTIFHFLKLKFSVLYDVYVKHDLITMLTSYRNLKLKENFVPLIKEKWHFINYLFGGTNFAKYRVEFEIFDVFLFFGFIGSIYYLFYYFKLIFKFFTLNPFARIQFVFLLCVALLSGTFFNNAPIALYMLVVLSSLNLYKTIDG